MLKYLTTVVAALTPLLYIHGNTYWSGYVGAMGVPVDLFQINLEETLIQGYFAYTVISIPYLLIILIYVFLALLLAHSANELTKINWVKNFGSFLFPKQKVLNDDKGHPATEKTLEHSKKVTLFVFGLTLFIGGVLIVLIQAEKLGKESGENKIKQLSESSLNDSLYLNNSTVLTGKLLLCGAKFCGVFKDNKTTVIPISSIAKIVTNVDNKIITKIVELNEKKS